MPHNDQLLLPAHALVRGWLIPFASRIVVFVPQQNGGRYADEHRTWRGRLVGGWRRSGMTPQTMAP
jgi:hypothetical protein